MFRSIRSRFKKKLKKKFLIFVLLYFLMVYGSCRCVTAVIVFRTILLKSSLFSLRLLLLFFAGPGSCISVRAYLRLGRDFKSAVWLRISLLHFFCFICVFKHTNSCVVSAIENARAISRINLIYSIFGRSLV